MARQISSGVTRRKFAGACEWQRPCWMLAALGPLIRNLFQSSTSKGVNVKRQYRSETKSIAPEQIEILVVTLHRRLQLLESDIEAEEERTRCKDRRDASYSILARTLIARRDNLSVTIAALQERLAALEAPEWNYG